MTDTASYCENCGQALKESKLSIGQLFRDFVNNIFNLDGRLFRSTKHIIKPAFLAQEFTAGKRKSYVNPIRFLLVMLVLLFFLLQQTINTAPIEDRSVDIITEVERNRLAKVFENKLYEVEDTISETTISRLKNDIFELTENTYDELLVESGNILNFEFDGYTITRKDAYSLSIDSLFTKYKITDWKDKFIIKQFVKVDKSTSQGIAYIIGNLIWGIIISIFLIALLLKILYIRSAYYYVEHLIVIILYSAKLYACLNVVLLLQMIIPESPLWNIFMAIFSLFFAIYFILSLKSYYNQGWLKTIIKSLIIGFASVYILTLSLVLVSLISMALF